MFLRKSGSKENSKQKRAATSDSLITIFRHFRLPNLNNTILTKIINVFRPTLSRDNKMDIIN